MHPSTQAKKILTLNFFALVLMFSSLGHVTADMYTPSMPKMAGALNTSIASVQMTLAIYMFSFSLSHLFYGPLSDRIGRRLPMLAGIALTVIGGLLCLFASSISVLLLGRFIQGAGVGACSSVGRTMLRDILSGSQLAKLGSYMSMVMVFVTAAAPTLGGYIQHYFDWRINFLVLFIYSAFVLVFAIKVLPETNFELNPHATKIKMMFTNYLFILKNKTFIGYSLCACSAYAGVIAYLTTAPFLLQNEVGLTPVEFGWMAFIIAASVFTSAFINTRLVVTKGIQTMILTGNILMITSGTILLIFGMAGILTTLSFMLPVALFAMGAGFTFSNAFAGAFQPFPKMAGSVGALYGFSQTLAAGGMSAFMTLFHPSTQLPLALTFITLGAIALTSLKKLANS